MAPALQSMVLVYMLISSFSLISIAVELRRLRSGMAKPMDSPRPVRPVSYISSSAAARPILREGGVMGSPAGYAIFVYRRVGGSSTPTSAPWDMSRPSPPFPARATRLRSSRKNRGW